MVENKIEIIIMGRLEKPARSLADYVKGRLEEMVIVGYQSAQEWQYPQAEFIG